MRPDPASSPELTAPPPIRARLNQEVVKVLTTPENRERFRNAGAEVVASTPEVLAAEIKSEVTRLEKIFKGAGIREK